MKDGAELAAAGNIAQRPHRWPKPAIVSDGEDDTGRVAGIEHPRGVVAAECQRLFAEYVLLRGCRGDHLRQMQRMRRGEQNGIDGVVGEHGVEIGGQVEFMFGAKASRAFDVGLDRSGQFQAAVAVCCTNQVAAPAAEPDNRAMDHVRSPGR